MKIGSKLKALRVQKNYTPLDMAELLGISESTYRRYETDKYLPNMELLYKLTQSFQIKLEDLVQDDSIIINQNNNEIAIAQNFANIQHELSQKLVEQYEVRIQELKEQISYWKNLAEGKK